MHDLFRRSERRRRLHNNDSRQRRRTHQQRRRLVFGWVAFDESGCKACSELHGDGRIACDSSTCTACTEAVGENGRCVPCTVKHGACLCGGDELFDTNMMACGKNKPDRAAFGFCTDVFAISNGSCVISSELITTTNAEDIPHGVPTPSSLTTRRACHATRLARHASTRRRASLLTLQTSCKVGHVSMPGR